MEDRLEQLLKKWKDRLGKGLKHLLRLAKNASHELSYLERPENKAALRHLLKESRRILRAVLPKKGGGWLRFGGSDPCQTGQVLELLAVLYPLYGKRVRIIPEFEEPALETELHVTGSIYLFKPVFSGISLLLDKNLRKLYRHFASETK